MFAQGPTSVGRRRFLVHVDGNFIESCAVERHTCLAQRGRICKEVEFEVIELAAELKGNPPLHQRRGGCILSRSRHSMRSQEATASVIV